MDTEFEHPCVRALGGSELSIQGVVRGMQFRLKGSREIFFLWTEVEKAEEAILKAKQEVHAKNREADRLARKEKERIEAEEAQRKAQAQRNT